MQLSQQVNCWSHYSFITENLKKKSQLSAHQLVCVVCVTPKYLSRGISDFSDRYKSDKKLHYFLSNPC